MMAALAAEQLAAMEGDEEGRTAGVNADGFYVKKMNVGEWMQAIGDLGLSVWETAALPESYWNKDDTAYAHAPIHAPGVFAGVSDGVVNMVTEFPQLIKLGYDVATKEEVRRGIWAAVKEISPSKIKDWAVDFYEKKKTKYLSGKEYVVAHEVGKDAVQVVQLAASVGGIVEGIKEVGEKMGRKGARFLAKSGSELKTFLSKLTTKPAGISYSGKMYRYIPERYATDANNAKKIIQTPSSDLDNRFRTGLYLSETKAGNAIEANFYDGRSGKQLYEISNIEVDNLLDLTNPNTIETLGTSLEQMKKTSVPNSYEFTQEIAIWAKNNGYNGVKFYGTQGGTTDYINYMIFEQSAVDKAIKGTINPISW